MEFLNNSHNRLQENLSRICEDFIIEHAKCTEQRNFEDHPTNASLHQLQLFTLFQKFCSV
ncbi:hypothetical protein T05_16163 [Trichinella murrelli]|uniref:Uncharacterized protein n=1 Tax=Trichinella murrelli TaxID=144512 RepID=A0A0V0TTD7_9BILA|nr:hypothetical protein T05_16163 [Trichinella murrelli]